MERVSPARSPPANCEGLRDPRRPEPGSAMRRSTGGRCSRFRYSQAMPASRVPPPADAASRLGGRGLVTRAAAAAPPLRDDAAELSADVLRKAVNTLAIVPRTRKITALARKTYNVLLFHAQEQGVEREAYRVPLNRVIKTAGFNSNDHAVIKDHLRAMVSTTVEWQSPTTGEGTHWNVCGLLAHATLSKVDGQNWLEWSYARNLKQELIQPTVFARLRLETLMQFRSHAAIVLYEIGTRYVAVGRTARQAWQWWQPVLTGNPGTDKETPDAYRFFKRDTILRAVAEVNALSDIDLELVEHRQGRRVDEIQFRITPKRQAQLQLQDTVEPVDLALVSKAQALGVAESVLDGLVRDHGEAAVREALHVLERRAASSYPAPLQDPVRYLRALMPAGAPVALAAEPAPPAAAGRPGEGPLRRRRAAAAPDARPEAGGPGSGSGDAANRPGVDKAPDPDLMNKRRDYWHAEWLRRRRQACADEIRTLSAERQLELQAELLADLQRRNVHPTLAGRLQKSGWQHPMVVHEMVRFYAVGAHGDDWDKPRPEDLLQVAAELGEGADPPRG